MTDYTVLAIDDEPHILSAMRRLFRKDRLQLLTGSSAEEALQILKTTDVAVLLTDNVMPGMSGVELVRTVKDLYPHTIRILLSGYSDMQAILSALNEGEVFRFLLKPWEDSDLKATVHLALAHYHLMAQNRQLQTMAEEQRHILRLLQELHPRIYDELSAMRRAALAEADAADHGSPALPATEDGSHAVRG